MRAFIAFPLPEGAAQTVWSATMGLRNQLQGVKWVLPVHMHVTLYFLGEIDTARAEGIMERMKDRSWIRPVIEVSYSGVSGFPEKGRARVLVARIERGRNECAEYHARLRGLFIDNPPKTPFSPHITIGRARSPHGGLAPDGFAGAEISGAFPIARCVLFQSVLTPAGPIYRELTAVDFSEE